MISLGMIREALGRHDPIRLPVPAVVRHRASVALPLAGPPGDLSLCFICRAARSDDRWSGQMAFPGGRAEEGDRTPRAVAERETFEEVGIRLDEADYLGGLSHIQIRRRGLDVDGVLSPFVYYTGIERTALRANDEVASAHWIELSHLWDPANCTSTEHLVEGSPMTFPGIRYADQVIWGLTHRILTAFSELIAVPLPGPPPPD